jgi:hypothetical protein
LKKPVNLAISTATLTRTIRSLLSEILDILHKYKAKWQCVNTLNASLLSILLKDMKVIEIQFDHSFWEVLYAKRKTFYIYNVTHDLKR